MIAGINAQASAAACGVAWLAELDFFSGLLCVTTAPLSMTATTPTGTHTFTGLGSFAGVSGLKESADTGREMLTMSLSIVDTAMLALALGNVEGYRGRAARLYLQLFDEAFQPVGSPLPSWAGVMDKVVINRRSADSGGGSAGGSIDMQCSRSGLARSFALWQLAE